MALSSDNAVLAILYIYWSFISIIVTISAWIKWLVCWVVATYSIGTACTITVILLVDDNYGALSSNKTKKRKRSVLVGIRHVFRSTKQYIYGEASHTVLNDLPDETLLNIFSFCSQETLKNLRLVSRRFDALSSDSYFSNITLTAQNSRGRKVLEAFDSFHARNRIQSLAYDSYRFPNGRFVCFPRPFFR